MIVFKEYEYDFHIINEPLSSKQNAFYHEHTLSSNAMEVTDRHDLLEYLDAQYFDDIYLMLPKSTENRHLTPPS